MPTIANASTLEALIQRLGRLTPDSSRRWGTLTAGEMLCHLGDAGDAVLGRRVPPGSMDPKLLPLPVKWLMLYSPLPFPKGVATRPGVNPRMDGTKPTDFAGDRTRVIDGMRLLAAAAPETLRPTHFRFGTMSASAWRHLAYKHVDHHLRQFGV